jgi:hypothetical protein
MVLLGDEAQVEARFSPFKDSANLDARLVGRLCQTYHSLRNRFGRTLSNSMVTWVIWNLVWIRLEIVLVSEQDSCMVCTKHTVGSKIILDALGGTLR